VATDDLYAPLGLNNKPARARRSPVVYALIAGLFGLGLATSVICAVVGYSPFGPAPAVVVAKPDRPAVAGGQTVKLRPTEDDAASPQVTGAVSSAEEIAEFKAQERARDQALDQAAAGRGERIITIIDGSSGARREVKIPAAADSEPSIPAAIPLATLPAIDAQLVEMTRDGPIPRVGANGVRAAQAFAQPAGAKPNSPQIAIVITGLGTANANTAEALSKLPAAVTFALSPVGTDLDRLAGKARGQGHELLLQVPMESPDAAEGRAAPRALLASLSPEQNIERLRWLMSRFQGYVGVANQMGDRLTAAEATFAPIVREISSRGLIYVDDGSSPRSLAGQIAAGGGSGFAKANLAIDAVPSAIEIEKALAKLEALARQNGMAVGFAAASPLVIERVAKWSKAAEGRGFSLVPITAAASRGKPS
jgi:polysaccharide deacetylase 2 family uncharacterized protein YibQ